MQENSQNKKDKRRGLIVTFAVHILLLIIFMIFGLSYMEPKPEKGIVINFGNSSTGMGNEANGAPVQPTVERPSEASTPTEQTPADAVETPVQTQNTFDAPAINTKKEVQKPVEKPVKKPKETETVKQPQPSDQLSKILDNVEQSKQGGEGENPGSGDQGAPDGDKNSPNRTGGSGGGGTGGDGNYLLGSRDALVKPKPDPCPDNNDVGRVVVKIYVDRNGNVTQAIPGERIPNGKASTTTSSCLFSKAKSAAMKTTWQADGDAPVTQVGYIIYNFGKN